MTAETKVITLQCLCKANTLPINVDLKNFPGPAGYCHCDSCRHLTGTLCNSDIFCSIYGTFPFEDVSTLGRYKFSHRFDIYFCKICGTTLIWFEPATGRLSVSSPTVVESDVDASRGNSWHMFIGDTKDGGLSIWMPRHDNGQELVKYVTTKENGQVWTASRQSSESSHGLLPGYCVCKGVKFWITRPDKQSADIEAAHSNMFRDHIDPPKIWWLDDKHERYTADNCACTSCRLASGCEAVQWAFVPRHNVRLDASGEEPLHLPYGSLKAYQSSPNVTRYFCHICRAMVFWTSTAREALIDVAVGLLDAREGARAENWLSWNPLTMSYPEDSIERSSMVQELSSGLQVASKVED